MYVFMNVCMCMYVSSLISVCVFMCVSAAYVPRSQRHATSIASPDGFGPGLSRASSLRAMRTHNGLANDTPVDQKGCYVTL